MTSLIHVVMSTRNPTYSCYDAITIYYNAITIYYNAMNLIS